MSSPEIGEKVAIDIGCGRRKRERVIGIDQFLLPTVDVVADLEKGLPFLRDNSVDIVRTDSFLEHVVNYENLMREIHRVCKPTAEIDIQVPHFSNPYFYSDYTHKRFFGLYTFDYFVAKNIQKMKRIVPDYYVDFRFEVLNRSISFYSPFKGRRLIKRLLTRLVNLNRYTQELYEENLCWLFPCYMLKFTLQPIK